MIRRILCGLWTVVCGLLLSCTPSFKVPPLTDEERALLPDHSALSREEVPKMIAKEGAKLRDVEAEIVAYMRMPNGSGSFDGALVLKRPSSLRMKAFRGGSATFMDLLLTEAGATLYLPGESKAYLAEPEQPIRLGKGEMSLTARQFLDSMTFSTDLSGGEVVASGREWVFRDGKREYAFDRATLFLSRAILYDANGRPALTSLYREYRPSDGIWFPRLIEIRDGGGTFQLTIFVRKARINLGPLPGVFKLWIPQGVEIIRKKADER